MKTPLKLLQAHDHAGKEYLPGDVIEVDDDLAEWLTQGGVATSIQDDAGHAANSQPEPLVEAGSSPTLKEKRK